MYPDNASSDSLRHSLNLSSDPLFSKSNHNDRLRFSRWLRFSCFVPNTYVLLEMEYLACRHKTFSAIYEWGWMESDNNLSDFAGIYTILKKKDHQWTEHYEWISPHQRRRGKTRPKMPEHQCSKTRISYPRTQDSWNRCWKPPTTYANILFIDQNKPLFQETINSYNTHRAALIIGEDSELLRLISTIQHTSTTTVLDIFHELSTLNKHNYLSDAAYVKAVFSYKDWKLQVPTSRMKKW